MEVNPCAWLLMLLALPPLAKCPSQDEDCDYAYEHDGLHIKHAIEPWDHAAKTRKRLGFGGTVGVHERERKRESACLAGVGEG